MKKQDSLLLLLISLLLPFLATAQKSTNPWSNIPESQLLNMESDRQIVPKKYETVHLDREILQEQLDLAPERFAETARNEDVYLRFPMPDGSTARFKIYDAQIMHPDLAARYPMIHSYAAIGIDDPTAYARFDVTEKGFHGMILSSKHSTVFIDPYAKNQLDYYIVYYKKDFEKIGAGLNCLMESHSINPENEITDNELTNYRLVGDCDLRTYRLAMGCTGEYADFHGGTTSAALSAINTSMTRVNGVFERDLTLTMQLIANTDELIYLNGNTDPYTNFSGGTMLDEHQSTVTSVIGTANYDMGHVFSTGGGGIAGDIGVACRNNVKAMGVTGGYTPVGDPFDIDFVAHEMGHQLGANHTQNNNCGRVGAASMEPGSASTIMGYAGICNPNVQNNSDDYYHAISLQEIGLYTTVGQGDNCPIKTSSNNSQPTVDAGQNLTIPASTPFTLTAVGTDQDNDILTYCWEQMDPEFATMPPQANNNDGPAFRSLDPTTSPSRTFPNLNAVINNTTPTWEVLPSVNRTMNFRVTVRDNSSNIGCTGEDDVTITTRSNAGPFLVLVPNTNVTWSVGESQDISWDVANTDNSPINCSEVDILLSTDGGQTYDIVLAAGAANDGSATITVPDNTGNQNRVRIECADNVFFDISDTNFTIEEADFLFNLNPSSQGLCGTGSVTYTVGISGDINETVDFTVSGLPDGATAVFSPASLSSPGSVELTVTNSSAAVGSYTLQINVDGSSIEQTTSALLDIYADAISETLILSSPIGGATEQSITTALSWESIANASSYLVEISDNPSFDNIIETTTVTSANYTAQNLTENSVFYWRVQPVNPCSSGDFSTANAFQTTQPECLNFNSTDVPVSISATNTVTVTSTIDINEDLTITDIDLLDMEILHTWIGDLDAMLISPSGTQISLFDRPGSNGGANDFGCEEDNILASFDDASSNDFATFEATCNQGLEYAIEFTCQPIDNLADLNGESSQGTWTLSISDNFDEDGGTLEQWALQICREVAVAAEMTLLNEALLSALGATTSIENTTLLAAATMQTAEQITYTITDLPLNGTLWLNGQSVTIGTTFTQADIDNGSFSYIHDGTENLEDTFTFDVLSSEGAWLNGNVFTIEVFTNSIGAVATLINNITCHDDNDGEISVNAVGGTGLLTYSINGMDFQESNIFSGLAEGTYTVTVKDEANFTFDTDPITISNPTLIEASNTVEDQQITVEASGGTGDLEYSIDCSTFQASNVFTELQNGTYDICVQDNNGCSMTTSATVFFNSLLVALDITSEISCAIVTDGIITASVSGGLMPYQYSLDGDTYQDSPVFENLGDGEYIVTVLDAEGFTMETNSVSLVTPDPITASTAVNELLITVTASGGTGDLSYSLNGGDFQLSPEFTVTENGTYAIVIIDENMCNLEVSAVVFANTLVSMDAFPTSTSCEGEIDGVITVVAEGGTAPLEYSIGGDFQESPQFTGLMAGDYVVTVRDADGFELEQLVSVDAADPIVVNAVVNENSVTINTSGGVPALEYSIDGGENWQSENVFTDLPDGDYVVLVIDFVGCTNEVAFMIDVVSVFDNEYSLLFEVNPNPSRDIFKIAMNQATDNQLQLRLFDVQGRLIIENVLSKNNDYFEHVFDLSQLASGIYNLQLNDGKFFGHKKLVVIK